MSLFYIALLPIAWFCVEKYAKLLTPWFQWIVESLAPHFKVQQISIELLKNQHQVFLFDVISTKYLLFAGHIIPTGQIFSASTLVGHVAQHLLIVSCIIFGWPARSIIEFLCRLFIAAIIILIIETMDVPLVILGSLQDLLISKMSLDLTSHTLVVYWMHFMNGGGRLAISIAGGIAVVYISRLSYETLFSTVSRKTRPSL